MAGVYTVRQGDYLAKIARAHGFSRWQTIYDHSGNKSFRNRRPDPNLICPGDQVFIPDNPPRQASVAASQRRKFKLRRQVTLVHLVLRNGIDENPLPILRYELAAGRETFGRRSTDAAVGAFDPRNLDAGKVFEKLAHPAARATLKIWLADAQAAQPDFAYTLLLGHLDPVEEITGVQARLKSLGFDCGAVDGVCGPRTEAALKSFQSRYGLPADGQPDRLTQLKLEELYGC